MRETVLENSPNPSDPFNPVPHLIEKNEIENALHLWDGELVTIFHPSQRHDLKAQNEADRKRKAAVGRFTDPFMDGDKMKGVMQFNVERLESARFGKIILNDAREGRKIECSTGYLADYKEAPPSARYQGQQYVYTQHNIRPDHIAVIPFGTGKCSIKDGCGLNQNSYISNILETGRVPDFEDTTSRDWNRENLEDAVDGFLENADTDLDGDDLDRNSWSDNPDEFRQWAAQKSILGSADEDTYDRGTLWQVVHYSDELLNENALDAVISGRGEATEGISEQTKTAGQGIARNLLEEEFNRDLPDEDETENIKIRPSFIQRLPEMFSDFMENEIKPFLQTAIQGNQTMGLKSECRDQIIEALNEKPFQPSEVETWDQLEDEDLVKNALEVDLNLPDEVVNQFKSEPTTNALTDADDPEPMALVEAAIEVYEEAGGNLSNSVLAFLEWIQTRSEAEAQEVKEIKDVLEEFTLLTEHEFLGRADVRDLRSFIQNQMQENEDDPSSLQEGGSFLSELSDEQKEALGALEPDTIRALGKIKAENIEQLNALLDDAASERERLTSRLVENEDAPFSDESELTDLSLNKLRKLDSAFSESTDEPDGEEPSFVGAGGGGQGFNENTEDPDESMKSLSSEPVLTGGVDS